MTVRVCVKGGPFLDVSRTTVRRRAEKMLAVLRLEDAELSIALVNDATIRDLNHRFRGFDEPTDVLAFALSEAHERPNGDGVLGDIILSVDTAQRQAKANRRSLLAELTMLLAHGLLHLIGYDHRTAREDARMKKKVAELEAAAITRT